MIVRYFKEADAAQIERLFIAIVSNLPYYNDLAKQHEIERYMSKCLTAKAIDDPFSIIVVENFDKEIIGVCFSRFDDFYYLVRMDFDKRS